MFSIDFNVLVKLLLPSFLRKDRTMALLKCFVAPVKLLYDEFNVYRLSSLKRLEYTGQVIYMEKLLNDTYLLTDTPTLIFIEDISNVEFDYLFNKIEAKPGMVLYNVSESEPPVYIGNASEYVSTGEFIVNVPHLLYQTLTAADLNIMKTLINQYKIAGKRFLIQSY